MSGAERFLDTNVLLYLLSADTAKADRAEAELTAGGVVSVQVLNEFTAVASGKLRMPLAEIREVLEAVRAACQLVPLDAASHDLGLQIVERYGISIYDAMIVACALNAGCKVLLSEDLQDGQVFERHLKVRNPFR